jgi:hypothetical protein
VSIFAFEIGMQIGNGAVNVDDLLTVLGAWGPCQ